MIASLVAQVLGRVVDDEDEQVLGDALVQRGYVDQLVELGAVASIGSVGDSYDNALAGVGGRALQDRVRGPGRGPMRTLADLELAIASWVHWFNTARPHSMIGHVPPVEYEQSYYAHQTARQDPKAAQSSVH